MMQDNPIILVCGFGRCGTSLFLQMLAAGGIDVTGRFPSFEAPQANALSFDAGWLAQQRGRAVKLIDPHLQGIVLPDVPYRIVWLDRDLRQQARSIIKFVRLMGGVPVQPGRRAENRLMGSFRRDRPRAIAKLQRAGRPISIVRFEHLVRAPAINAVRIAHWLGLDMAAAEAMAAVVRLRTPSCLPGLLELDLYREREQHG